MAMLALCWLGGVCLRAGATTMVEDIRWDSKPAYTRCVVELSGPAQYKAYDRSNDGYVYVDLFDVRGQQENLSISVDDGVVKAILVVQHKDRQILRLIFYLKMKTRFSVQTLEDPHRLIVDIEHPADASPPEEEIAPAETQPSLLNAVMGAPRKKVVVIDPGHGGKDPGTVSRIKIDGKKIEEKDLALKTALELKKLIDKSPNMEARLTRETDKYVSLDDRNRMAEHFKGDLYVSIHYNAGKNRQVSAITRGMELYFLSPEKTQQESERLLGALKSTEKNNGSSNLSQNPKLQSLLEKMIDEKLNRQFRLSRLMCQYMEDEFKQDSYFGQYYRGIKDAGFRSLVRQYTRPTVLVEVGYLTHSKELAEMVKPSNQRSAAIHVFNAINRYFHHQDPNFKPMRIKLPE